MKTLMIVLALSMLLPAVLFAGTGEISSAGNATVSLPPDNADIHMAIVTKSAKPDLAASENARIHKLVVRELKKLGFKKNEVITVNYRVDTEYEYDRSTGARKKTGYVAGHRIKVNTDDFTKIGLIIDNALEAGATEVTGVNYYSSRIDEARREALTEAVKKAFADAEAMAVTLGGSLGDLVELSTGGGNRPIPMKFAERSVAAQTEITPDELSVTVAVSGRWKFIPPTD